MKRQVVVAVLLVTAAFANAESVESIHAGKQVEVSGFDCAKDALHVMDLLGRGPDFPGFVIADVETELDRQEEGSQLLSISCTGEPQLEAGQIPAPEDKSKNILSSLSMSFPLNISVINDGDTHNVMYLTVVQNYLVENLDKDNQVKVTQNFIVKNQ